MTASTLVRSAPAASVVEEKARTFHVVQVGYDESMLKPDSGSDAVQRQARYFRELQGMEPGARITILVLTFDASARGFESGGVTYVPVPYRRRFQIPFRLWRALEQLHARQPIDVVTTQTIQEDGLAALFFSRRRGVAVLGQIHIDIFQPAARRENFGKAPWRWLVSPLAMRTLGRYNALRVVGSRIRKHLEGRKIADRSHLIPVAMPLMSIPAETGATAGRKIVFVGRLEAQKRLDLWIDVAAEIAAADPEVTFEIAGEGSLRADLERRAEAKGIAGRVRFLGFVPYDRLPALYASSKLLLITSSYEGFGRVVAEAMHFGVPVVGYKITGVEDIVEDGKSGFLHAFGDVERTAQSALRLLRDEPLRASFGEAGRRFVDDTFDPDRLSRDWVKLLLKTGRPIDFSGSGLLSARRPTFERWRKLSNPRYTLLRALEHEVIHGLRLEGRILDIGGGERTSYYPLLEFRGTLESANIDPSMRPTYLADLNEPLDLPSDAYDTVISMNTFEHLVKDQVAIREAIRVLKPGGRFHFTIPYLYKVHGSPSDYHRHTAFWWRNYLISVGVRPENLAIEPLVWSPLTSGLSLSNFGNRGWLRRLSMLGPLLSFRHGRQERLPHRWFDEYAVGYYITGTK